MIIFSLIIGIVLSSGIVYAASLYKAKDISYNKENWEVTNVNDALDDLYEIQKTSVNNAISIYIGWGSRVYDVTINIDCLKEETIDNLQKENEESTLKKEDELEEDSTEENQGVNNTVNNIESNSKEENIDLNNTVDNSEEKDQNYIMVED